MCCTIGISHWKLEGTDCEKFSVFVFSAVLSSTLFAILQSAVGTIFIRVVEDYESNDGSEEKPYCIKNVLIRSKVDS